MSFVKSICTLLHATNGIKKIKEFCDSKDNFKYLNYLNITIKNYKLECCFYHFKNKNKKNNVICFNQQRNN